MRYEISKARADMGEPGGHLDGGNGFLLLVPDDLVKRSVFQHRGKYFVRDGEETSTVLVDLNFELAGPKLG